jgi:hypothetical protein
MLNDPPGGMNLGKEKQNMRLHWHRRGCLLPLRCNCKRHAKGTCILGALTPGSSAKEKYIVQSGHRNGEQMSRGQTKTTGRLMQIDEKKLQR